MATPTSIAVPSASSTAPTIPSGVTPTSITLDASTVTSMLEVRAAIDSLDVQIVSLLATRMRFIEAAARIKPTREAVRDEWRKADVISKVKQTARAKSFPETVAGDVYETLVEGCIAWETRVFDETRGDGKEVVNGAEGKVNGSA